MKAPRAGVMGRVVGRPAGSSALAWPQRECLGAHPTPAGSWSRDWWGDRFMFPGRSFFPFFLHLRSTVLHYKVTSSLFGSPPLRVPSGGWTTGWFMPTFNPSCIPSSLRPLLSSPVSRVIWLFLLPLICQLFLFPGLFSSMVFCKFLPHSGRGADLVEAVVDSLEEVSRGKLFSLLPGLAPVGCFDWPPFHIYTPQFVWTEEAACIVGSKGRV